MTLLEITLCAIAGLGVALTLLILLFRGPEDTFAMAAVRLLNRVVCRTLHDVTAMDRDGQRIAQSLPIDGPCIVVANHRSGADPSLIGATTSRFVCFLMAREYYETPGMQWLFRIVGSIPVNRDGNDLSATRRALEILRKGGVVGIFPQGGIREDDDLDVGKAGVAVLASRAKAPVVPVYIVGSPVDESVIGALFFNRSKTRIRCGEPLHFPECDGKPSRADVDAFTDRVLSTLKSLRPEVVEQEQDAPASSAAESDPGVEAV
ncbi:MAG: lysophospholipid acyltransferase family protein [Planctomycetota bacterium]